MKSLFQFNVGKISREERLKSETKLKSQVDLLHQHLDSPSLAPQLPTKSNAVNIRKEEKKKQKKIK